MIRSNREGFDARAFIHIPRCAAGSYYTGVTRRAVQERVSDHAQGLVEGCYTANRRLVALAFSAYYERVDEAIAAERRIKGWSRAKEEAYMTGDFERLKTLSRRKGGKSTKAQSSPFETGPEEPPQGGDSSPIAHRTRGPLSRRDHRLGAPRGSGAARLQCDGEAAIERPFCLAELADVIITFTLARFGEPEIFNKDQAAQFASAAFLPAR